MSSNYSQESYNDSSDDPEYLPKVESNFDLDFSSDDREGAEEDVMEDDDLDPDQYFVKVCERIMKENCSKNMIPYRSLEEASVEELPNLLLKFFQRMKKKNLATMQLKRNVLKLVIFPNILYLEY